MFRSTMALPMRPAWRRRAPRCRCHRDRRLSRAAGRARVGVGDGGACRANDLAAAGLEARVEGGFGIMSRTIVGDHGVDLFQATLGGPGAERLVQHRRRCGRTDHVSRLRGDDRRRSVHDDHELLGLLRNVPGGERIGRQGEARENVDPITNHEFLRETLGDVRRDAADILADEDDLSCRRPSRRSLSRRALWPGPSGRRYPRTGPE